MGSGHVVVPVLTKVALHPTVERLGWRHPILDFTRALPGVQESAPTRGGVTRGMLTWAGAGCEREVLCCAQRLCNSPAGRMVMNMLARLIGTVIARRLGSLAEAEARPPFAVRP